MTIQSRDVLLDSANAIVDPTLVVCYHAHFSIAYMGAAYTGGIVISCESWVLKCYAGHERKQNIGGKEKWGMGEGE